MSKYEKFPVLVPGTAVKGVKYCDYCGQRYNDIFEEIDHLTVSGEPLFDPEFRLSDSLAIGLGTLLRVFNKVAGDKEKVEQVAQEVYAILYKAEHDPKNLNSFIKRLPGYTGVLDNA